MQRTEWRDDLGGYQKYSFHFYAGQLDDSYPNILTDCTNSGVPIFVSEWGINEERGGEEALTQAKEFAAYLNQEKYSFAAWSLCNKDEAFSALLPSCETLQGWEDSDFTETGKILFDAIAGGE